MESVYKYLKQKNIKLSGIILAVIIFVMVGVGGVSAESSDESSQLTQKGIGYYNAKDYNKAIETLTKAIEIDPNNSVAYSLRGDVYQQKKMNDQAIMDYTKALEIDPANYGNYGARAFSYYYKGLHDKAKEDCNLFLKYVSPTDPRVKIIKQFSVDAGYTKKIVTSYPDIGNSTMNQLLIKGIESNDLEIVQTAVNNGANVNIYFTRNDWSTPFTIAVSNNNIAMVDFLLDKGADPNVIVYGQPFILNFLSYNNERTLSVIQHLIDRGTDITIADRNGNTVFMNFYDVYGSSYEYKKNMTKYFIAQGVNVNQQNNNGDTPLHRVASRGYVDIAKILLDAGADPNKANNQFKKPLDNAISSGNKELINLLISLTK